MSTIIIQGNISINQSGTLTYGEAGGVTSVNGATGIVTLDADDISDTSTTNKYVTSAEKTKLSGIEDSADVTDESNVTSALSGATLTDAGTPASDDKILIQDTSDSDNLKTVAFSEFGSGAVDSVNTQTGVVVLDADDIDDSSTTNKFTTSADQTKLSGIETGADVTDEANVKSSLDGATITTATVAGTDKVLIQDADDSDTLKTVTAQSIADLASGGGGVSDGDKGDITVSGSGATWTVDDEAITNAKLAHVSTDTIKGRTTAGTGDVEDMTPAQVRTLLNVADGADVSPVASVNGNTGTVTLDPDDLDDTSTTNKFTTASDITKLSGIEANADVTDSTNVESAGAIMDSDISEGEGFIRKTGAGAYEALKTNLGASVAPTATDDSSSGYAVGSRWIDTTADKEYVCLDATATSAVWTETTSTGGGGGGGAVDETEYTGQASEPTAPSSGNLNVYALDTGDTPTLTVQNADGKSSFLERQFHYNTFADLLPRGSGPWWTGWTFQAYGTDNTNNVSTTNLPSSITGLELETGSTAGSSAGYGTNGDRYFLRSSTSGIGGFRLVAQFAMISVSANGSFSFGVRPATTYGSGFTNTEPSSATDFFGIGFDGGDSNFQVIHNDASGTGTKTDLGSDFPSNDATKLYTAELWCKPGDDRFRYTLINHTDGVIASGDTGTSNIPTDNLLLGGGIIQNNMTDSSNNEFKFFKMSLSFTAFDF